MNFNLDVEQQALVEAARRFAAEALTTRLPLNATSEQQLELHRSGCQACADAGYVGLPLPEAVGGRGLSLCDCMLVFEAMADGGGEPGFLFSLGVTQFAVGVAIWKAAAKAQQDKWLGGIAKGATIGALAVSEREAGSDSFAMAATARERAGDFVINGEKMWVTNAPVAGLFLVLARTDDLPGAFGISCFIVPADAEGVTVSPGPRKAGLRGAPWGTVTMKDVAIAGSLMLGGRGGGGAVFQDAMRWERCGLFAIVLGAMTHNFEQCLGHVRSRKQYGQPLINNDNVARAIALMKTRVETARLMLYKAAATIDDGKPDDVLIPLAKAYVSEAAIDNAAAAQELFGAPGILEDSVATNFLNDMLPFRILSGPTDVQYKIASRQLPVS